MQEFSGMLRKRPLGRTGLEVSEISLGTAEIGMAYGIAARKPAEPAAAALLHAALDNGVNLLDTARAYGDAEAIVGRTLKARRNEYILLSKVPAGLPDEVRRMVDRSLRELQTERIDVMLIHCAAGAEPDDATAAVLADCKAIGKIRFIGASVYGERAALASIDAEWCDCVEIAYSALDRRPEQRTLARAEKRGVGVVARSVLLKGALTARFHLLPEAYQPLTDEVRRLAIAAETTIDDLPRIAYRYVLSHGFVSSALVGASGAGELRAAIAYAESAPLAAGILKKIAQLPCLGEEWLNPGMWPKLEILC